MKKKEKMVLDATYFFVIFFEYWFVSISRIFFSLKFVLNPKLKKITFWKNALVGFRAALQSHLGNPRDPSDED